MLHTISDSAIDIELITPNDAVLFWQNGVILTIKDNVILNAILAKTTLCYVLDNDIMARGLAPLIDPRLTIIDMEMVVSLTEHHYPQMKW
ncbi:sulfurtransferase complex subunit TusB [Orbus mooreae]|uniref:sulfurtransferase complex subunit TusB n=1 Tax=Orbus mooreae TaxID=3074107 RepID=UPI00370DBF45